MDELANRSFKNFEVRVNDIRALSEIGNQVADLALAFHASLAKEFGVNAHPKKKFDMVAVELNKLKGHPSLQAKYGVLYAQSIVLLIAAFETFMTELASDIVNNNPGVITWPEKGGDKRFVRFDPALLSYGNPTIGDLVVGALPQDVNFQDLQSTVRFLDEYLGVKLSTAGLRDDVVLYQAVRHIVGHNNAKINHHFVRQIRETKYYSIYRDKRDQVFLVDEDHYKKAEKVLLELADRVSRNVAEKVQGSVS